MIPDMRVLWDAKVLNTCSEIRTITWFWLNLPPIKVDAATMAKLMPKPMIMRLAMNMAKFWDAAWIVAPIIIKVLPNWTERLRPNVSAIYGTNGTAKIAPRAYIDEIRPRIAECGLWKTTMIISMLLVMVRKIHTCFPRCNCLKPIQHGTIITGRGLTYLTISYLPESGDSVPLKLTSTHSTETTKVA